MYASLQADKSDLEVYERVKVLRAKCTKIEKAMEDMDADVREYIQAGLQHTEDQLAMTEDDFSKTATGRLSARFHAFVEVHMTPAFDLPALEDVLG